MSTWLPDIRREALRLIVTRQGRTFDEVETDLMLWMRFRGVTELEDLAMAGYAISSLTYDGYVYLGPTGDLYPVNYHEHGLPAQHRLMVQPIPPLSLEEHLNLVDSHVRGQRLPP